MTTSSSIQSAPDRLAPGILRPTVTRGRSRIDSVDFVRGFVMILMALDHVRDYFGAVGINPTDAATTTVPLFFTRWITHFCAPTFFLLTGTGAYLRLSSSLRPSASGQPRGGSTQPHSDLSRFLITRGVWMLLFDAVIMRCLAWQFNVDFRVTFLIVLWALGWAMITLSLFVRWPPIVAGTFGLLLIAGHNLFDRVSASGFGVGATIWRLLHQQGPLFLGKEHTLFLAYPVVPWIGITAVGYALGQIYDWDSERRRAFLLRVGLTAIVGFIVLRTLNIYGDLRPWSAQATGVRTALSFLDTNKNPPSLLFALMTLGPILLLLRAVDGGVPQWLKPTVVFGRVPLFYFFMHVVIIHVLVIAVGFFRYGDVRWAFESSRIDQYPFAQPKGWPVPLPVVYAIWIGVVVALWPLCRWFAGVKARRRDWWLSYL